MAQLLVGDGFFYITIPPNTGPFYMFINHYPLAASRLQPSTSIGLLITTPLAARSVYSPRCAIRLLTTTPPCRPSDQYPLRLFINQWVG